MDTAHTIRDAAARRGALDRYAIAHDHFAEQEQTFTLRGDEIAAAGAHEYALWALRAYRGEVDNPDGHDRPCSVCGALPCIVYAVSA